MYLIQNLSYQRNDEMKQSKNFHPIEEIFLINPFISYAYAYPHKTTYRTFKPSLKLSKLWSKEPKDNLFLYFHIPFCESKCSYCNLFSTVKANKNLVSKYLDTMRRQSEIMSNLLGDFNVAVMAIGGGTPTLLNPSQLNSVFNIAAEIFEVDLKKMPISVETSPNTINFENINILKKNNVGRISIGIQTFNQDERTRLGRFQSDEEIKKSLKLIKTIKFPVLNIDLIYGIPGQTLKTFTDSLKLALSYHPEEIYLYPLYIRPLTLLGKSLKNYNEKRLELYRFGRQYLLNKGYVQNSMRMFRFNGLKANYHSDYSCQEDGMIGMGCGSRSYTQKVHYSEDYAVNQKSIIDILINYCKRDEISFGNAYHGIKLSLEDQYRRFILKSILKIPGLNLKDFEKYFEYDAFQAIPELKSLLNSGYLKQEDNFLNLTEIGLERSDVISYWLYSNEIKKLMRNYQLK